MPKFLLFLSNPVVLMLIVLYKTAAEKAINTDLILISPRLSIFYSLNLVISFAHFLSTSFH
jgi:hypothetical protein